MARRTPLDELDDATLFALFQQVSHVISERAEGRRGGLGVYVLDRETLRSHRIELPADDEETIEAEEAPAEHGGIELRFNSGAG